MRGTVSCGHSQGHSQPDLTWLLASLHKLSLNSATNQHFHTQARNPPAK